MNMAYTLTKNHAWLQLLNHRIESLCQWWQETLPEEVADEKIDDFMALCRCVRQEYVHRSNCQRIDHYIDAQFLMSTP